MDFDDDDEDRSFSQISCGPNCTAPRLLVGIMKVEREGGKTFYEIRISHVDSDLEWTVKRRYSDFLQLRDTVYYSFLTRNVNQCFGCRWFCNSLRDFNFPRKHLVSSKDRDVISFRKNRLDRFARLLAAHTFSAIPKCVRCSVMPFYEIRDFFTTDAEMPTHVTMKMIHKTLKPEKFAPISDPSKSKIEFRRGHGIYKVLQVEAPIYLNWREYNEAARKRRMQRRRSSFSSTVASTLASTMSIHGTQTSDVDEQEEKNEVDLEEEKPLMPALKAEGEDAEDVAGEIATCDSAVALQPLRKPEKHQMNINTGPDSSCWEPWGLASPKRTAAKQA